VYRVGNSLGEDGTYDASLVYEAGTQTGLVGVRSLSTMIRDGSTILYRGWPVAIEAPTAGAGGIYRVGNSLGEDGTYDASLVYEAGTQTGVVGYGSLRTVHAKGNEILYRGWPVAVEAPESGQGGVYRARNSLGEDGTYDASLVYEVAEGTSFRWRQGSTVTELRDRIMYRWWPVAVEAPEATAYCAYAATNELMENGLYHGDLVVVQELNGGSAVWPFAAKLNQVRTDAQALQRTDEKGMPLTVLWRRTFDVTYHALKHNAWAAMDGGCSGTWNGPIQVRANLWEALKVKKVEMKGLWEANWRDVEVAP
jgi:hypothetical protein